MIGFLRKLLSRLKISLLVEWTCEKLPGLPKVGYKEQTQKLLEMSVQPIRAGPFL